MQAPKRMGSCCLHGVVEHAAACLPCQLRPAEIPCTPPPLPAISTLAGGHCSGGGGARKRPAPPPFTPSLFFWDLPQEDIVVAAASPDKEFQHFVPSPHVSLVSFPQEDIVVAIASPDKDFFQLLRAGVMLLRPPKKPAPGERVNKFAMLPYYPANFKEVGGWGDPRKCVVRACTPAHLPNKRARAGL